MTQLCIEDWTDSQASQWNHAHAVHARPKATGRMTFLRSCETSSVLENSKSLLLLAR